MKTLLHSVSRDRAGGSHAHARMKLVRIVLGGVVALVATTVGCSVTEENPAATRTRPAVGSEGGACPPAGTSCDVGLVCRSNVCVRAEGATASDAGGTVAASSSQLDASEPQDAAADADSGPVQCVFKHPLLDGGARFCEVGECYCADPDSCYPKATAQACCKVAVTCL